MKVFEEALAGREKGEEVPISIGTALAIESLCGLGEFYAAKPPIGQYKELWINLRTLFRNLYGAIDRQQRDAVVGEAFVDGLVEDMSVIRSTIDHRSKGSVKVVYYLCSHKGMERRFAKARLRPVRTDRQRRQLEVEAAALGELREMAEDDIRLFDIDLEGNSQNTAIITHQPVNLLSRYRFKSLDLLESHTGKIKPPSQWYTKLTGGNKLTRIPFNRMTMQVFGDGNEHFSAMIPSAKKEIVDIAEKDRWTSVTTDEKIRYSLNKHVYDPRVKQFYLELL